MSKRARALILGATLAAMNLAGLTTVAHAQANHDPNGKDARRLATERQAGETRRERPGHRTAAGRCGRHPPAGAGPGALLRSQRDTRPADRPGAARIQRTAQLAPRIPRWVGCWPSAGGRAGRARRQTGRPQSPDPARGLTRSHGHAARWGCRAHRQPHRLDKHSGRSASRPAPSARHDHGRRWRRGPHSRGRAARRHGWLGVVVWDGSGRPSVWTEEHNGRWNEGERNARESDPPPRRPARGPGSQERRCCSAGGICSR